MTAASVMQRMARAPEPPAPPTAAAPLLARTLRAAADRVAKLDLRVSESSCTHETVAQVLEAISPDEMMIAMMRDEVWVGVALLSPDMRAAIVEAQTIGILSQTPAEPRAATGADVAMARPVLARFLGDVCRGAGGSEIDGWGAELTFGPRVRTVKELELTLPDVEMGVIELSSDLGETGRSGRLRLCVPLPTAPAEDAEPPSAVAWQDQWRAVVDHVPARLEAMLHRMRIDLPTLEGWAPGDVVPLLGATVGAVELRARDGAVAASGRLGQMGGFRAVRIETSLSEPMIEEMGLGIASAAGAEDVMALPDPGLDGLDAAPEMELPDFPSLDDSAGDDALPEGLDLAENTIEEPDLDALGGEDLPMMEMGDLPDLDLPLDLPDGELPDLPSLDDL